MTKIPWQKVWSDWEAREAPQARWQTYWQKEGHANWQDWRTSSLAKYNFAHLPKLEWREEIHNTNPQSRIAQANIAPFQGWSQYYEGPPKPTPFSTIAESPLLSANANIQAIIAGIQRETIKELTIIATEDENGKLTIIDGCHSASALMLIAADTEIRVLFHIGSKPPRTS